MAYAKAKDSAQQVSAVSYLNQNRYKTIRRNYLHVSAFGEGPESSWKGLVKDISFSEKRTVNKG